MKRLLLGLMLLVTATAASAEWTRVDNHNEFIQYVDKGTIRRNGHLIKMWDLTDYKTVQKMADGKSYLSDKGQQEYDCKEEKMRQLALTSFAGKMGQGKAVYSDSDPYKWIPIGPGSIGEILWKAACEKQ